MRLFPLLVLVLVLAFGVLSASAQPRVTFQTVTLSGGAEAHFVGTTWSYSVGAASSLNRFAALESDGPYEAAFFASGTVGDEVRLARPVLPGEQPASVRSASHLVFDAQGEGTVLVALQVSPHTEPYVYPVTLHPGAKTFRVPLERFRQRGTGSAFLGDTVVHVSFHVVARRDAPKPFALTVGGLAFEHKRPLGSRY